MHERALHTQWEWLRGAGTDAGVAADAVGAPASCKGRSRGGMDAAYLLPYSHSVWERGQLHPWEQALVGCRYRPGGLESTSKPPCPPGADGSWTGTVFAPLSSAFDSADVEEAASDPSLLSQASHSCANPVSCPPLHFALPCVLLLPVPCSPLCLAPLSPREFCWCSCCKGEAASGVSQLALSVRAELARRLAAPGQPSGTPLPFFPLYCGAGLSCTHGAASPPHPAPGWFLRRCWHTTSSPERH